MPAREDAVRMRHMLDAAQKAQVFVRGRSRDAVAGDEPLTLALTRLLEIIGEAAKSVSAQTRQRYPGIPWKAIGGTRDRLIHGYFDVDWDILWDVLTRDLPPLIVELEKALAELG